MELNGLEIAVAFVFPLVFFIVAALDFAAHVMDARRAADERRFLEVVLEDLEDRARGAHVDEVPFRTSPPPSVPRQAIADARRRLAEATDRIAALRLRGALSAAGAVCGLVIAAGWALHPTDFGLRFAAAPPEPRPACAELEPRRAIGADLVVVEDAAGVPILRTYARDAGELWTREAQLWAPRPASRELRRAFEVIR